MDMGREMRALSWKCSWGFLIVLSVRYDIRTANSRYTTSPISLPNMPPHLKDPSISTFSEKCSLQLVV